MIQAPLGIIADDLTGANDTGAQFSRRGAAVLVPLSLDSGPPESGTDWDLIALNSGTRNLPPEEAWQRMERAVEWLARRDIRLAYLKVDSTLRGNWARDLAVALRDRPGAALLAPAFPLNGRTVEDGVLLVRGTPLHQSEAGRDGLSPVRSGRIADLLEEPLRCAVANMGLDALAEGAGAVRERLLAAIREGARVLVCDARGQGDLAVLAEAALPLLPRLLLAGSAGLARELAERLDFHPRMTRSEPAHGGGPVLVIAGSRSLVTAGQIETLLTRLTPSHARIDPAPVDGRWSESRLRALAESAHEHLRAAQARVWLVSLGVPAPGEEERFAQRSGRLNELLGAIALGAAKRTPLAGMVLTGGDVAASVLKSLGAAGVRLGPEVLPGVPLGEVVGGPFEGLGLVTKAGAFGPPDALVEAVTALAGGPRRAAGRS